MAYGLDTDVFLNAFYRMASRRGLPEGIFSDNGTNFKGADAELKSLVRELDENKMNQSIANKGVVWHFNPPLVPHFGGAHETMIKSMEKAIQVILGKADITVKEFTTAIIGAAALINSRPLTLQQTTSHWPRIIFSKDKLGVSLHQPPEMKPISTEGNDGAVYRNWCTISGADGCENGYLGSTHDRNGSRHIVTSRLETSCWWYHRTYRGETGRSDGYSRSIQGKIDTCAW